MDKEIMDALDTKLKATTDQLKILKETGATKEELNALETTLKDQGKAMQDYLANLEAKKELNFDESFYKFLLDNAEEIESIYKGKTGEVEFNFDKLINDVDKVVGPMATTSGGDVAAAPANHNTMLNRINLRNDNPIINMCTVIPTNKASLAYTETSPKEGGYAFVLEAGTKPMMDFSWAVRYAEPHKIAAYEVFSEEVVKDIPRLMATARGFLKDRHDLFKADAIMFADGIDTNPEGATVIGREFVAGDMALAVEDPTIMDVVNACVTDIYTTPNFTDEAPYMPNLVLLNPVDFFLNFQAAKDTNRWALYGGVTLFNSYQVGGMTIMPWAKIPAGKIFVGDMSKYNISNWVSYSVRLGWINEQFISNEFTMVGESRSHYYVKNFDRQAFLYDDIATIVTAISAV